MGEYTHHYRVCGWHFASMRPIEGLAPVAPAPADVHVAFATFDLPATPPLSTRAGLSVHGPHLAVIVHPLLGKIRIEDGARITADHSAEAEPGLLRAWILGTAFGVLCQQRGEPVLHASAVHHDGRALVIAGRSGAGKSTTAAALIARGAGLLADDIVRIDLGAMAVWPGYPSMKLWRNSADALGYSLADARPIHSTVDKFHFQADAVFSDAPQPLQGVLVLGVDAALEVPSLERLRGGLAMAAIANQVYRMEDARFFGTSALCLEWAAQISQAVPVYQLTRPAGGCIAAVAGLAWGLFDKGTSP